LQKQANKFEKQAKNWKLNRKTSPTCAGRKIQQNEKSVRRSNKKKRGKSEKTSPK